MYDDVLVGNLNHSCHDTNELYQLNFPYIVFPLVITSE